MKKFLNSKLSKGLLILLYTPFVIGLIFLLWAVGHTHKKVDSMKNWVTHEAQVIKVFSEVNEKGTKQLFYYTYKVNGVNYSNILGRGYLLNNYNNSFFKIIDLKKLKTIKTWVNPKNPKESAVIRGWNELHLTLLFFTFIWICFLASSILAKNIEILELRNSLNSYSEKIERRNWFAKILKTVAIACFIIVTIRLVIINHSNKYLLKLVDNLEIIE